MRQSAASILGWIRGHSSLQPVARAALAPVMDLGVKGAVIIISTFGFIVFEFVPACTHAISFFIVIDFFKFI